MELILPPLIGGVVSSVLSPRPPAPPPPPPTMSRAEAVERAQATLNPLYQEMLNETLRNLQRQQIARGFFGQLPGAALERSTAADIETRRAQQIAQLAEQLIGQAHARAMDLDRAQLAAAQDSWAGQQQNLQNIMSGIGMGWNIGQQMLGGLDILRALGLWGAGNQTDPSIPESVSPASTTAFTRTFTPQASNVSFGVSRQTNIGTPISWIQPYGGTFRLT